MSIIYIVMNKNYKIVEKIGNGSYAKIYKVKIDSEYYALRKQKFIKSDIKNFTKIIKNDKDILDNTDKVLYKIIYFNKFINKINDNHFDKLYNYKISKDNFKQIISQTFLDELHPGIKDWIKNKLIKSNYCFETITDLKDDTLASMYKNKRWNNNNEKYSMVIQIIYALYLMHSNNFYHTDLHWKNIMYKKTNIKSIKILNFNVPTFGYIWTIIDYELIQSPLFKYLDSERRRLFIYRNLAYEDFMMFFFNSFCYDDTFILERITNNIKLSDKEIKKYFLELKYYEDAKIFFEYAANNDHIKIIKYFNSKIIK